MVSKAHPATLHPKIYEIMNFKITIPKDIHVILQGDDIFCEGPLGSLTIPRKKLDPKAFILFQITESEIHFHWVNKKMEALQSTQAKLKPTGKPTALVRAYKGQIEAIFKQSFQGLLQGYLTHLELIGVGFRVEQKEQQLEFKLGFSHPIFYDVPSDIRAIIAKPTELALYGVDLNRLTQVAAQIKKLRPPEMYKGKGIRLSSDILYLKEMKKS